MESRAKILVIEDDPAILLDIVINLERSGYEVVGQAHNAQKAKEIIKSKEIDLILLDIQLEGVESGIDLAHFINNYSSTPFLYISSYTTSEILSAAAETNPMTYLVKPFKQKDVVIAVQMALSYKRNLNVPSLEYLNQRIITPLTRSEYKMLVESVKGKSATTIAHEQFISIHTVKTHLKKVYLKMDVHSKVELQKKLELL